MMTSIRTPEQGPFPIRSKRGYGYPSTNWLEMRCPVEGCPVGDDWEVLGEHLKTDHHWSYDQLNAFIESVE